MNDQPLLFCVGANHVSAGVEIREELFISKESIDRLLPEFIAKAHISEALVLSTCNRLELIGVLQQPDTSDCDRPEILLKLFKELQQLGRPDQQPLSESLLRQCLYTHTDKRAVEHVFSVASGLDSLVVGETQITGQFKDSVQKARDLGTLGPLLHRLSQDALKVAGKVRTNTEISRRPVSVSHAAIDLAHQVTGGLDNHAMLFIGAGEMARIAAQNALKHRPRSLCVINRSIEKAQALVDNLEMGQACGLDSLHQQLTMVDVVVSSTAKEGFVLEPPLLAKVQKARRYRPLYLVDIALPRDIAPQCTEVDNVYVFDIDDLKQVIDQHLDRRRQEAHKATGIIVDSALHFGRWRQQQVLGPAVKSMRSHLDDLTQKELQRALTMRSLKQLSSEQISDIEAMFSSIVNRLVGNVSQSIKNPPEGHFQDDLIAALAALFPEPNPKEENDPS